VRVRQRLDERVHRSQRPGASTLTPGDTPRICYARTDSGYSRDILRLSRSSTARFTQDQCPDLAPCVCSPNGISNPCLHLERLSRAGSVTCGGGRKRPLTCGFRSWSIPVATPRFSMSCGIGTGSKGGGALQPPLRQSSDEALGSLRPRCSRRDACRRQSPAWKAGDDC